MALSFWKVIKFNRDIKYLVEKYEAMVIYFQLSGYLSVHRLNRNSNGNWNANWNDNLDNFNENCRMAQPARFIMISYNNLYDKIISFENLIVAWQNARKGKTKKHYVIKFEEDLFCNLMALHCELRFRAYSPKPLKTFILRDPKTRKISKSDFRDRIVHHAIVNILEPIFERTFIYDSCANRNGKGNLFAIQRLELFIRKVSRNGEIKGWFNDNQVRGYYLKADIKHYFQEVDCNILVQLIRKKIADEKVIWLIERILENKANFEIQRERERESNFYVC